MFEITYLIFRISFSVVDLHLQLKFIDFLPEIYPRGSLSGGALELLQLAENTTLTLIPFQGDSLTFRSWKDK